MDHISDLCKEYQITNYRINQDGSIDVDGDVNIAQKKLREIPLHFNKVSGNFICFQNKLRTLNGCPKEVGGDFMCYGNSLTSLKGAPVKIPGNFDCSINKLTSLEYCPEFIGGDFIFMINKLTTLFVFPNKVIGKNFGAGNELPQKLLDAATQCDENVIFKYMNYYGVWENVFNEEALDQLVSDVVDGLL